MKIILIEDDALLVRVLRIVLAPAEVVVAPTVGAAEELIRGAGPKDTVLVDLKLPDSKPAETILRIADWKDRVDAPRIIVVTGCMDERVLLEAEQTADAVAHKAGPVALFEALRGLGVIRRRPEPCTSEQNVEAIERGVLELTGSTG